MSYSPPSPNHTTVFLDPMPYPAPSPSSPPSLPYWKIRATVFGVYGLCMLSDIHNIAALGYAKDEKTEVRAAFSMCFLLYKCLFGFGTTVYYWDYPWESLCMESCLARRLLDFYVWNNVVDVWLHYM